MTDHSNNDHLTYMMMTCQKGQIHTLPLHIIIVSAHHSKLTSMPKYTSRNSRVSVTKKSM